LKKYFFIVAYIFFIMVYPAFAYAEDWAAVQAEGSVQKSEEKTDVKKEALDQALRKSVSTALAALLKKESIAVNPVQNESIESEIYANPRNFILNYRIVSDGWITHMAAPNTTPVPAAPDPAMPNQAGVEYYHIWIEANIDSAQLRNLVGRVTQTGGASFVKIVILGVTDYRAFKSLLASIEGIAAINDISYDSFYRGKIVLTAKINGNGQNLTERIAKEVAGRYAVAPGGQESIVIKAANVPSGSDQ
jgi:hypothetical protein